MFVCVRGRQTSRKTQRDGRVKSINGEKGAEKKEERERETLAFRQEREKGKSSKGRNPD